MDAAGVAILISLILVVLTFAVSLLVVKSKNATIDEQNALLTEKNMMIDKLNRELALIKEKAKLENMTDVEALRDFNKHGSSPGGGPG